MTQKEKADQLIRLYSLTILTQVGNKLNMYEVKDIAEQCALIAVENEYNAKIQAYNEMAEFCPDIASQASIYAEKEMEEVKQEIQKV
jgi:hypothetical protein